MNSTEIKGKFTKSDYPGLYQSADTASIESQRSYFGSLSSYLVLLIVISAIPYLNLPPKTNNFLLAFLFIISLSIMLWLIYKKPDESWYYGRAVAESVKTRTWRSMMKADPYNDENETVNDKLFINDLKLILEQNKKFIILDPRANLEFEDRIHSNFEKLTLGEDFFFNVLTPGTRDN